MPERDWIEEAAERITCVARNWGAELVEHDNHLHLKADAVRIIKREHAAHCEYAKRVSELEQAEKERLEELENRDEWID